MAKLSAKMIVITINDIIHQKYCALFTTTVSMGDANGLCRLSFVPENRFNGAPLHVFIRMLASDFKGCHVDQLFLSL